MTGRHGAGQPGSHRATGSSSSTVPDSASSMTATAANCLLTEAIWNRVCGVHLAPDLASARPPASSRTADPARVTVATPGRPSTKRIPRA